MDCPRRRDTIFRSTSTTKPITAAATMILAEECKLRLMVAMLMTQRLAGPSSTVTRDFWTSTYQTIDD